MQILVVSFGYFIYLFIYQKKKHGEYKLIVCTKTNSKLFSISIVDVLKFFLLLLGFCTRMKSKRNHTWLGIHKKSESRNLL